MAKKQDIKGALNQLEEVLEMYLVDKAPFSIPENIKELIVNFSPYLIILGIVLTVPSILAAFGLGLFLSPFSPMMGAPWRMYFGFNYTLSMIILAVSVVMEAIAVPGLLKRQESGWRWLFYASLVSVLSSVIYGGIFGALIGVLISWYVLFQVKEYYK